MSPRLSAALVLGTAEPRWRLARAPFLCALFEDAWGQGVLGEHARALQCVRYLASVRELYAALGGALWRHRLHPQLRDFPRADVLGVGTIEEDLRALAGEGWEALCTRSASARCHAARVRAVARERPCLLIAHAYVATVCESVAGLPRSWGLRSFGCPGAEPDGCAYSPEAGCPVMRRWAQHLDGLALAPEETAELVRESRLAFLLRERLCAELDAGV